MADNSNVNRAKGSAVRFISWNVKGLSGPVKMARIFAHLKKLKTETAFLQETNLRAIDHNRLKNMGWTYLSFKFQY